MKSVYVLMNAVCSIMCLIYFLHMVIFSNVVYNIPLSLWICINIFVSLFHYFILKYRYRLSRSYCLNPFIKFWSRNDYAIHKIDFWLDAWKEYSCNIDSRFMNPSSFAYVLINAHILLIFAMIVMSLSNNLQTHVYKLLGLQCINTITYIITLIMHRKIKGEKTRKTNLALKMIYFTLPLIWVLIPALFVFHQ